MSIHFLKHHGVQGQKWGERHGPPYPLDPNKATQAQRKANYTPEKKTDKVVGSQRDLDKAAKLKTKASKYDVKASNYKLKSAKALAKNQNQTAAKFYLKSAKAEKASAKANLKAEKLIDKDKREKNNNDGAKLNKLANDLRKKHAFENYNQYEARKAKTYKAIAELESVKEIAKDPQVNKLLNDIKETEGIRNEVYGNTANWIIYMNKACDQFEKDYPSDDFESKAMNRWTCVYDDGGDYDMGKYDPVRFYVQDKGMDPDKFADTWINGARDYNLRIKELCEEKGLSERGMVSNAILKTTPDKEINRVSDSHNYWGHTDKAFDEVVAAQKEYDQIKNDPNSSKSDIDKAYKTVETAYSEFVDRCNDLDKENEKYRR